jgi:hypothetical protein
MLVVPLKRPEDFKGCCNSLVSNCDLRLNEVTFVMVHNAMSSRDNLFVVYNNMHPLERALVGGTVGSCSTRVFAMAA